MLAVLRILGWLGMGLSALLFIATIVLWVRSLGHEEQWSYERVEPNPRYKTGPLAGVGTERRNSLRAIHHRLWLTSSTWVALYRHKPLLEHDRSRITADQAQLDFDSLFQPGQRSSGRLVEQAWRFAGSGLRHKWETVDPSLGWVRFDVYALAIPFWMLAVLFGIWPAFVTARRLLRRNRYAEGLCPHCGYDLRATPDRCPECGRAPEP